MWRQLKITANGITSRRRVRGTTNSWSWSLQSTVAWRPDAVYSVITATSAVRLMYCCRLICTAQADVAVNSTFPFNRSTSVIRVPVISRDSFEPATPASKVCTLHSFFARPISCRHNSQFPVRLIAVAVVYRWSDRLNDSARRYRTLAVNE